MSFRYYTGSYSDIGVVRAVNQDAIYARAIERNGFAVAIGAIFDGVGGMERSELASGAARECLDEWAGLLSEWIDPATADAELLQSQISDVLDAANDQIIDIYETEGIRAGTTATVILCVRERYYIHHIGDSRCSIFENGALTQITADDTVVGFNGGQQRVFLANFLGKSETVRCSRYEGELSAGNMLIFGSDGFFHTFTEEDATELHERVAGAPHSIAEVCQHYVGQAITRGETDNISVGVIYTG